MTKEEFMALSWFDEANETHAFNSKDIISFFDSNVCIPRGENRHPYADGRDTTYREIHGAYFGENGTWSAESFKEYLKYVNGGRLTDEK